MRLGGKKTELLGPDGGEGSVEEGDFCISQLRLRSSDEILVEQANDDDDDATTATTTATASANK